MRWLCRVGIHKLRVVDSTWITPENLLRKYKHWGLFNSWLYINRYSFWYRYLKYGWNSLHDRICIECGHCTEEIQYFKDKMDEFHLKFLKQRENENLEKAFVEKIYESRCKQ